MLAGGFEIDGRRQRIELAGIVLIDGASDDPRVTTLAALRESGRQALAESARRDRPRAWRRSRRTTLRRSSTRRGRRGRPRASSRPTAITSPRSRPSREITDSEPGEVDFFFLPLAHSFARATEYLATHRGTVSAFAQSIESIPADIRETRPHYVPSVPRIFEKMYARIQSTRAASSPLRQRIFDWAIGVGRERSKFLQRGERCRSRLRLLSRLADRLVFAKVSESLGGRVKYMMSGGAPLAREIQEFFHAAGVLILEGYGLTETTPILTANRPDRLPLRHRRSGDPGSDAAHRRGRRNPREGAERRAGLLQAARGDERGVGLRGLVSHRRHRRNRRRWIREDHGSQEGPDQDVRAESTSLRRTSKIS